MGLRSIYLKKAYTSENEDLLSEFYIPVLKSSRQYDRLTGFFSSQTLSVAARGVIGLIKNDGIMRLIASPKLNEEDLKLIKELKVDLNKYIENKMLDELDKLENEFVRDHIFALGWMLANKKLYMKIAIIYDNNGNLLTENDIENAGLFHQKVGIFRDLNGDIITFSGSINETLTGWTTNIEEFKVFRSWNSSEKEYVDADVQKFEKFWNNQSNSIKVIDLFEAVKNKLIEIAPKDIDYIDYKKYYKNIYNYNLFEHQIKAVDAWFNNNKRGIFEMATGTGKTITALECLNRLFKTNEKIVAIITCPYKHLVNQWIREINKYNIKYDNLIEAYSSKSGWKNRLAEQLIDLSIGYKKNLIIVTTHNTFSSLDFINIINNNNLTMLLIADEVHGLGAEKTRRGLIEAYNYRLGLSATPKRWFDSIGTDIIYNYFNGTIFEFSLKDAINTINPTTGKSYLTPYRYIPKFISLNDDELECYVQKTRAIAMKINRLNNTNEKEKILEKIIFDRANIIKNAKEKYKIIKNIIKDSYPNISFMIIYCSPQQIDNVMNIINEFGVISHRFTMDESTKPNKKYAGLSERDCILKKFAENYYQIIVAMKCLDEGVDIPQARTAVLMSSSGNPREYIQRIGRIIRRYPNKNEANIYDIIVVPSFNELPKELKNMEAKIFYKELQRYEEIASIAINNAEALKLIYDIKNKIYT